MRVPPGIGRAVFAVLIVGAAAASLGGAQSTPPRRTAAWVSLGAGKAFLREGGDIAAHVEATYQVGPGLVLARVASASSIAGAIINAIFDQPGDVEAHDYAVLIGLASRPAAWHLSAAAGAGIAVFARDSAGTRTTTRRFTVPVEAQLAWRPSRFLGLVLCGFGSLNSRETFGGVTFGLQLGRLR